MVSGFGEPEMTALLCFASTAFSLRTVELPSLWLIHLLLYPLPAKKLLTASEILPFFFLAYYGQILDVLCPENNYGVTEKSVRHWSSFSFLPMRHVLSLTFPSGAKGLCKT